MEIIDRDKAIRDNLALIQRMSRPGNYNMTKRELNSIKVLCSFAADCKAEHVHVNLELLQKLIDSFEIAGEALKKITQMCVHNDGDNGEACACSSYMIEKANMTLIKIEGPV